MKHSLFISDLHLCPTRPHVTRLFHHFMQEIAPQGAALYVLGDLFEYWAGDDDLDDAFNREITGTFAQLSDQDTPVFLMHGNRDFLLGQAFASACHAKLLNDPTLIDLHGTTTLLSHGDALCTDDSDYQAFRRQVRSPAWQAGFLAQPLALRKSTIEQLRRKSEQEKQLKPSAIMDVNAAAVMDLLSANDFPRLIHGHTHRPAKHLITVASRQCERWVLPDWSETGGYLQCDSSGCRAFPVAI